jgi:hypothetical protein
MHKSYILKRNYLLRDFIVIFLVLSSPFLFYLYTFSPNNTNLWITPIFVLDLKLTEYSVDKLLWGINYKLLTIVIFSIWYLTCKHKWRYALLIPLTIESNKLINYFLEVSNATGKFNFSFSLLLSIPLILSLTYLSEKLKYYSYTKTINEQLDEEIDTLIINVSNFNKKKFKKYKINLIQLRKEKNKIDKRVYLTKLIKLREEFIYKENVSNIN